MTREQKRVLQRSWRTREAKLLKNLGNHTFHKRTVNLAVWVGEVDALLAR